MINLVIALFWLVIGLCLFFLPGLPRWQILDTGWSIGWVAIALAGYNLLRGWLIVRRRRPRRNADDQPAPREFHPEFDFTKDERPKNEPNL